MLKLTDWLRKGLTALAVMAIVGAVAAPAMAGSLTSPVGGVTAQPVSMSMMPGLDTGNMAEPVAQCRWQQYCDNYYRCYQRQICYVCWYSYGSQHCEWRWQ